MTKNDAIQLIAPAQTMYESDSRRYFVVADRYDGSVKGYDELANSLDVVYLGRVADVDVEQVAREWFASKGDS